jgi:Carbon-nitrogen hydrolase
LQALSFIAAQQQAISDANGRAAMSSPISISVIQHPSVFMNLQASIRLATQLVAEAAKKGAKLVVFPESWL